MKKVTLTPRFLDKTSKLTMPLAELHYKGAPLEGYGDTPIVAVVGTRKPTPYGKAVTESIVEELVRAGIVILSGLAIGIDALAHSTTLRMKGKTIAVLPSGLEKIYPAAHAHLARQILDSGGTLISEYSATHHPRKIEFLERNRLIASFADVVLIPEAAAHSGSLNTANHAQTVGTMLCAIPGPITSPMSAGTNQLLKGEAHTITDAQDVLQLLNITTTETQTVLSLTGDTEAETILLQKIAEGNNTYELLLNASELDITTFQTTISILEVQGRIAADELGTWRLRK